MSKTPTIKERRADFIRGWHVRIRPRFMGNDRPDGEAPDVVAGWDAADREIRDWPNTSTPTIADGLLFAECRIK